MSGVTIDTTNTLETVLAFVGPLVGVGVGALATSRAGRSADRRASRLEMVRALSNFMAAAELVAVELNAFPEDSRVERAVDKLFPRQRRIGFFFGQILGRAAFGQRLDDLRRTYQHARAEAYLVAPIEMIGLIVRIDEYLIEWQKDRGGHKADGWATLADELRLTAQSTVDEGLGRPYRAGEGNTNAPVRPSRREQFSRGVYALLSGRNFPG